MTVEHEVQRVLLLGPDDDARRALHLVLAKRSLIVAAADDIAAARKHLAVDDCDVVLARAEQALELLARHASSRANGNGATRGPNGGSSENGRSDAAGDAAHERNRGEASRDRNHSEAHERDRGEAAYERDRGVAREQNRGEVVHERDRSSAARDRNRGETIDVPVIAIVATRDVESTSPLLDAGAVDILVEPVDELAITLALRRLSARPRVARGNGTSEPAIVAPTMIGTSAQMQQLRATIKQVAATRTTVLITGETGTGKELVARAIHAESPRAKERFVAVNCAAIPATLLESELFGHVRGAFTDAVRDKTGLFEDANEGTLFLDEVGEIPLALQAKLLRVLQEGAVRRVGDTSEIRVDVRLIAATLRDLEAEVAAGRFREDLYYRLNVVPIHVPPLRERPDDIAELARFFARRHGERHGRSVTLSEPVLAMLATQPWPGNVRDLENIVERAVVLADGPDIDAAFLHSVMTVKSAAANGDESSKAELSIKKATRTLEQDLIRKALGATQGNRTNAAKLLEISHRALLYKMKEYGIT